MIHIRAILFEDSGWWCAQCLEYDIAAQAKTVPALHDELERVLRSQIAVSLELGREPFEGLPRAPQRFFDMYQSARFRIEQDSRAKQQESANALPFGMPTMKLAEYWQKAG
jgi:hypothetical protein